MAADCGATCPVEGGFYSYDPSVAGNAVLLALFCLLLPVVLFTGVRFRTPIFSAILTTALLLEILGFVGRVLLHGHRDSQTYFTLSLLGTLIGPSLTSLAVFVVLPHTLTVYGETLSPLRPLVAGFILYGLIILAAILQVVGLVFAAYGFSDPTKSVNIVAGGLGVQIATLALFAGLHVYVTLKSSKRGYMEPKHAAVCQDPSFKRFLRAMEAATTLLLAYSIYRIVEMVGGIDSGPFQNQVAFMIVCGALPLIASALLAAFPPGAAFGPAWVSTSPVRPRRRAPPPIQHLSHMAAGYSTHERYDPNIRRQISPKHTRQSPQYPQGESPGLPPNPRPSSNSTSPMLPRPPPGTSPRTPKTSPTDSRYGERPAVPERVPDRKSHGRKTDLVEPDALW